MTRDEIEDQFRSTFAAAGFQGERLDKMVEVAMQEFAPRDTTGSGPVRCPNCDDWMDVRVYDHGTIMGCNSCGYRETC